MGDPPPPPPSLPINRYKFIWRALLISNLALGAYMFIGASKRDIDMVKKKSVEKGVKNHKAAVEVPFASAATPATSTTDSPATTTTDSKTWDM